MSTVVVQLTARGVGAIAVLLVAGSDAREVLGRVTSGDKIRSMKVGQTALVRVRGAGGGAAGGADEALDEALVARVEQERFELHVHGGVAVMAAVTEALRGAGAEVVDAEEAIGRGLLGDVMEGEVVAAAQYAVTETGLRLLARQNEGGLRAWGRRWIGWLERADDLTVTGRGQDARGTAGGPPPAPASPRGTPALQLWEFHSAVQWVLERSAALDRLLAPARVAIVGAPNVGKSTLANGLLGRPMSITSELAGTTRDWVDAVAIFENSEFRIQNSEVDAGQTRTVAIPVVLVDTAGVRATRDPLEVESIARTHQQARRAEVVVLVLDATRASTEHERELLAAYGDRALVVAVNKVDRLEDGAVWEPMAGAAGAVRVSALAHTGLEELMGAVLAGLDLREVGEAEPWTFTARQKGLLRRAAVTGDRAEACDLLRELVGERP